MGGDQVRGEEAEDEGERSGVDELKETMST